MGSETKASTNAIAYSMGSETKASTNAIAYSMGLASQWFMCSCYLETWY